MWFFIKNLDDARVDLSSTQELIEFPFTNPNLTRILRSANDTAETDDLNQYPITESDSFREVSNFLYLNCLLKFLKP